MSKITEPDLTPECLHCTGGNVFDGIHGADDEADDDMWHDCEWCSGSGLGSQWLPRHHRPARVWDGRRVRLDPDDEPRRLSFAAEMREAFADVLANFEEGLVVSGFVRSRLAE